MGAHASGSGCSWVESSPDIDQPHGKDYLELQDIRKGVRKRLAKEHATFSDTTAGGEHIPGGCNIVDIVDGSDDVTDGWNDGTYTGGGLAYELDSGVLWLCSTLDSTYDGVTDVTVLKMHPDLQWGSQEVTWAAGHEFDASVDMSGNVAMDGDLSVDGTVEVGGNLQVVGDFSVDSTLTVGGDAAFLADASFDGTVDFGGDVAFVADVSVDGTTVLQNTVIEGDSTFTFAVIAGETGPIFKIFGDWSSKSENSTYTARTDGIALGYTANGQIVGFCPTATQRAINQSTNGASVTLPVKAGNTWQITGPAGTTTVYWLPFGDNT